MNASSESLQQMSHNLSQSHFAVEVAREYNVQVPHALLKWNLAQCVIHYKRGSTNQENSRPQGSSVSEKIALFLKADTIWPSFSFVVVLLDVCLQYFCHLPLALM